MFTCCDLEPVVTVSVAFRFEVEVLPETDTAMTLLTLPDAGCTVHQG